MRHWYPLKEDLSERQGSRGETGLHGWRSQFGSESQSSMWPDEIVMTPNEFKVLFETLLVACVSGSFSSQICTGPAGGEVGSLAEGGLQFDRVLRLLECAVDLASGSDDDPRLHLPDSVLAPRFDDLGMDAGTTKDPSNDHGVVFETVRSDEHDTQDSASASCLTENFVGVGVASPTDHGCYPETRPNFESREDPCDVLLGSAERAELIGLELLQLESPKPVIVELTSGLGSECEPSSDRIPSSSGDTSYGGFVHAFHAELGDAIELVARAMKAAVDSAGVRREGLPTRRAAIPTPPAVLPLVERVPDDVPSPVLP